MADQSHSTPLDEAADSLAEEAEQVDAAVEEAAEVAHDAAIEPVADAGEAAEEAAEEASEAVEEAVEEAVSNRPELDDRHHEEVYNRVLNRLREEGHLTAAAAEEVAGEAEHVTEQALEAPEAIVAEAPINPVREHWYYRPRRIGKRSV